VRAGAPPPSKLSCKLPEPLNTATLAMNDRILVKTYFAVIDDLGDVHGVDHRRPRMEHLLKNLEESASSPGEPSYCLCELHPARAYESVPLERRSQYPPVTPITDAEPKYLVPGPEGPIECVPTIHARRMEHILDQYLEIHEQWQAVFSKYVSSSRSMIEPDEADAFVAGLLDEVNFTAGHECHRT